MKKKKKVEIFTVLLHIGFVLACACFVLPLLMVIAASFSSEDSLIKEGFGILPKDFTTKAYASAFANGAKMIRAYGVTIFQAAVGTVSSCVVAGLVAYPLSRSNFRFKKPVTWFVFATMLIGPSMIPCYIVFAKYYHIADTVWIYLLPGLAGGAWNTMVFRTFFKSIPESLFESARLDGAKELTVFFKIVLPLSTPAFASIGFMTLVGKWNDYTTSMIYIRNENLYTLQFLLQKLMAEASFLKNLSQNLLMMGSVTIDNTSALPSESLKFAMCVIAAGPMLAIFPFFQKYFAKGLTIGAVKG